ncbi:MAG TPA: hypothetical protein O0X27_06195 [Methanocorpusculum sp.]|nr:hypothetical protein [Methanocorpusculum sp.]
MPPGSSIPNTPSAQPLFSFELMHGYGIPTGGRKFSYTDFFTPLGPVTGPISLCGTLTETTMSENTVVSLRISDPTGICIAGIDERDSGLQKVAAELEAPGFVYVLGRLRVSSQRQLVPFIQAETVQTIAKETRNSWICAAASSALRRLESASDREFAAPFRERIAAALDAVQPPAPQKSAASASLSDEDILDLIVSLYEGKSALRSTVIDALAGKGLTPAESAARIADLLESGDIYAPKPDILKVL